MLAARPGRPHVHVEQRAGCPPGNTALTTRSQVTNASRRRCKPRRGPSAGPWCTGHRCPAPPRRRRARRAAGHSLGRASAGCSHGAVLHADDCLGHHVGGLQVGRGVARYPGCPGHPAAAVPVALAWEQVCKARRPCAGRPLAPTAVCRMRAWARAADQSQPRAAEPPLGRRMLGRRGRGCVWGGGGWGSPAGAQADECLGVQAACRVRVCGCRGCDSPPLTSWYRSMHLDKHFCSLLLRLLPGLVTQTLKHLSLTVCVQRGTPGGGGGSFALLGAGACWRCKQHSSCCMHPTATAAAARTPGKTPGRTACAGFAGPADRGRRERVARGCRRMQRFTMAPVRPCARAPAPQRAPRP